VGRVRYEEVAAAYQAGRTAVAQPGDWLSRVDVQAAGERRVLDLGAGTGIFTRQWPAFGASIVVGVDPVMAMLDEAQRIGLPDEARMVCGRAEDIPLRSNAFDLAWLSAVIHHVADQDACAGELARVVVAGGQVLIRGFFAGTSWIEWLSLIPGAERAVARFPSVTDVVDVFEKQGFSLLRVNEVSQTAHTPAEARAWITAMRDADTLLTAFSDEEIEIGLSNLAHTDKTSVAGTLHLVTLVNAG
jgi:SAM-dependent methyltransferase